MEIEVNGKELKPTESIKEYIEKRLTRIKKYFDFNLRREDYEKKIKKRRSNIFYNFIIAIFGWMWTQW